MHRHRQRDARTFPATTYPTRRSYAGPTAVWVLAMVGSLLVTHFGNAPNRAATAVALVCFFVGALWYQDVMRGKPTFVTLDADRVVAGKLSLRRANLSRVLGRWVEAAYGTTAGSALTLTQGAESVTLGCRGAVPAIDGGDLPLTSEVGLVLAPADFRALAHELGCDHAHAPSSKDAVLTLNLVPSPLSARGLMRNLLPLLGIAVIAEVLGVVGVQVLHLPEVVLLGLSWALAAGGMVGMLVLARRPARAQARLRVHARSVAWLDGRRDSVLAECALDELGVERRRVSVTGRFGTSVQLCLRLSFPNRRKLYFGLGEGSIEVDRDFSETRKAPSLLVGRGEWDAFVKLLPH
ncbi:MAG TPA: hypothetical protein VMI54_04505 [Polyangiaceae bacterium]|nr:hypothetical protein [Polyangiaceae bacterium]